jgi:FdhE protein
LWRSYEQVCHIAAGHRPDLTAQLDEVLALAQAAPERVKARMLQYLELGGFDALEEDLAQQEELLAFVFNHTLRPFLRTYAAQLAPLLRQELWQRDACPICGGEPDFAILDDKAGTRYLICARCDTPWLYPRVKCPFCNTSDPADLAYYPSEDGKYRLYTCGACRRYLKTMDLRQVGASAPPAEVARILTVDLDMAAREAGYC